MYDEKIVDIEPMVIVINEQVEYTMMAYDWRGVRCITFAEMGEDGIFIEGLFPPDLVDDEESLLDLASQLEEMGFQLTYQPEQMGTLN